MPDPNPATNLRKTEIHRPSATRKAALPITISVIAVATILRQFCFKIAKIVADPSVKADISADKIRPADDSEISNEAIYSPTKRGPRNRGTRAIAEPITTLVIVSRLLNTGFRVFSNCTGLILAKMLFYRRNSVSIDR